MVKDRQTPASESRGESAEPGAEEDIRPGRNATAKDAARVRRAEIVGTVSSSPPLPADPEYDRPPGRMIRSGRIMQCSTTLQALVTAKHQRAVGGAWSAGMASRSRCNATVTVSPAPQPISWPPRLWAVVM